MRAALLLLLALAGCAPDGRQPVEGSASTGLVFVRWDGSNADLYRVRLADGAERRLLHTPDHDEAWPRWSEAARRLAFESRARGGFEQQLQLLDPERGDVAPVPPAGVRRQHWAAWAERDPRLALVFVGRSGAGDLGLGVFDLASQRFDALVTTAGRVRFYRPSFAPDGRRLVAQRGVGQAESTLWILEPGAEPVAVTPGSAFFDQKPRFSRDGSWVVFTRRDAPGAPGRVMRVWSQGGEPAVVANAPGADDHSARPSPVRDEVAFISDRGGSHDAYRVGLAGGRPRALTRRPDRDELTPRWSPDGAYLALTSRPPGASRRRSSPASRVVVVDRSGRVLLDLPGTMPDWMPAWR